MLLLLAATTLSAQTILKGDMNNDNEVTIADVTSVVNVVLGKAPLETISAGCSCEPYQVDNSSVVGSWSTPDGTSFQFNEDGTTTFPGGATYEFMPMQGRLLVYDAENQPVKAIPILKVESEKILTVDYATNTFTYFTKAAPAVTYYWYVGHNNPMNMTDDDIITLQSNDASEGPGWRTIGTTLPTYSQANPLFNDNILTATSKSTQYVALPSDQIKSRNAISGEDITEEGFTISSEKKTLKGVDYTIWTSKTNKKSFADLLY